MSLNRKDDNPDDRAALRHGLTQLPAGAAEVFPQAQVRFFFFFFFFFFFDGMEFGFSLPK